MVSRTLVRVVCTFVPSSIVLPVGAQSKFPEYPARPASEYSISAETAGLTIGAEALDDVQAQRTYFHTELPKKGFVPVFVVIQNGSNGGSFLSDKTKVRYGPADTELSTPKEGSKAGQSLALATIPFVGIFGALKCNTASLSTSALTVGTHSIVAVYGGDAGVTGSTAPPLAQVVTSRERDVTETRSGSR